MSVPLAPRRLAERKYYFYAALSSLLPPQGLFLPLPLAPTLSPPYPPFHAPFCTYNAAVPFSQAPQALPTAANWKSPSRVACALLRASGRVGRCAARAACNPLRSGRSCGLDLSKLTGFIPPTRLVNRYGIAYRNGRFDVSLFPPYKGVR